MNGFLYERLDFAPLERTYSPMFYAYTDEPDYFEVKTPKGLVRVPKKLENVSGVPRSINALLRRMETRAGRKDSFERCINDDIEEQ